VSKAVIIIGSGLAGYMFAKEFRKLDTQTPLKIITQHAGNFYSKPLLSTALAQNKDVEALITSTPEQMAEQLNAEILTFTSVQKINVQDKEVTYSPLPNTGDPQIRSPRGGSCPEGTEGGLSCGSVIQYRDCILACGSTPITPQWQGDANSDIYSVNDLMAYGKFRSALEGKKNVAIIGAGLVGCEFANDLVSSGFNVNVIAMESYPLNNLLTQDMGEVLAAALEKEGVNWHFNKLVEKVNKENDGYKLIMCDGDELAADIVLSAIGIRPNTVLANDAGINVEKAIVVDRYLKTSNEHVYALGDCAQINNCLLQYVAPLLQSARALAKTIAGEKTQVQFPAMPVALKTTLCPFVIAQPSAQTQVKWKVMGEQKDYQALCYNDEEKLIGFILSGDMTRERGRLQRELPAMFEAAV